MPICLWNDNWYVYPQQWIYDVGVTRMEKTVATPYRTDMTLVTVRQKDGRRRYRHLLQDALY